MDSDWLPLATPVIGLVGVALGYGSSGWNEARRDRRTHEREREARREAGEGERDARLHGFQRETLLELQDALQVKARLTGKAMVFDLTQARSGQFTQLPPGLSDEMHGNGVDVRRLAARVLDGSVREAVAQFGRVCADVSMSPAGYEGLSPAEIDYRWVTLGNQLNAGVEAVFEVLGEALRAELAL